MLTVYKPLLSLPLCLKLIHCHHLFLKKIHNCDVDLIEELRDSISSYDPSGVSLSFYDETAQLWQSMLCLCLLSLRKPHAVIELY